MDIEVGDSGFGDLIGGVVIVHRRVEIIEKSNLIPAPQTL